MAKNSPARNQTAQPASARAAQLAMSEPELRKSNARFNAALQASQVVVFSQDRDLRYTWIQNPADSFLPVTVLGRTDRELLSHAEDAATVEGIKRSVLEGGQSRREKVRIRMPDAERWYDLQVQPEREGGRIVGVLGVAVDITTQHAMEEALEQANATLERQVAQRTAALRESERMAQAAVDGLTAHLAIIDERGAILAVNERWRSFARANGASLMSACEGVNYLEVCRKSARARCPEAALVESGIRDVLDGRRDHFSAEYPCHAPDEQRWYIVQVTPFPGSGPRRAVVAHENITARVRAEQALRASEEHYRQLVQGLPVALYTCDAKGRIMLYNAAAAKLWGREPQVPGERWGGAHRVFTPDGRRLPRSRWPIALALLQDEPIRDVELILERPDGSRSNVLVFPDPTHDATGAVTGAVNVMVDVTPLKVAEKALHERKERLRAILNTVRDSIVTIDAQGTIIGVNPAVERMFGYTEEEVIGKDVSLLMPSPYREEYDGYLERYARTGDARTIGTGREMEAQRKDGSRFPVELAVGEVNHFHFFTGVLRDITERKRLEAEVLRIAEQERLRVAADLHDGICQELAGARIFANVLRRKLDDAGHALAPEAARIEEVIGDAARHTREVARGMNPVVAEGSGLMHALRQLAETTPRSGGPRCTFQCPAPVAIQNPTTANELFRIAQEAVHNAVRHSGASRITVHLSDSADGPCLAVTDNGTGLPEDFAGVRGMGLRVMRYRASLIRAHLQLQRRKPTGTVVTCRVPREHSEPS